MKTAETFAQQYWPEIIALCMVVGFALFTVAWVLIEIHIAKKCAKRRRKAERLNLKLDAMKE